MHVRRGACAVSALHAPGSQTCAGLQVVSCEMIEQVGHADLPAFFQVVSAALKPGGKAAIQASRASFWTI